jgi:uncharacterized CHY-type Zn-finger protein
MLKEYKIILNRHNKPVKMATIICDSCHKEFDVTEIKANEGRKYCDNVCNYKGRGFKELDKKI